MNISLCKHKSSHQVLDAREFWSGVSGFGQFYHSERCAHICLASSQNSSVWRPNILVWAHFEPIFSLRVHGWIQTTVSQYGRPFVSKLWHDIRAVFSNVYLQSFLVHDIRAFFCHVYLRFIPKYMTIFLQTHIYAHKKTHIYALQTSMWYMRSQKVLI